MHINNIKASILPAIKESQQERIYYSEIYKNDSKPTAKNEFLFFIKPEITIDSPTIKLKEIINFILLKIDEFELDISNIKVLSAKYLKDYNIIAQHYGVINKLAGNAIANLSDEAMVKFQEIYNKKPEECNLFGGLEFIDKYPHFSPTVLSHLWQNLAMHKLAGGTYAVKSTFDGEDIYIINGFHPRQLEHFIEKGRSIIVFTLVGDISWTSARNNFIGATSPAQAKDGSIRKELLNRKDEFGIPDISPSFNGVHLSAGPVEGLIELKRYNSEFHNNEEKDINAFTFGKLLHENFSPNVINKILQNIDLDYKGKKTSIFDITEEMDSKEAIEVLKSLL